MDLNETTQLNLSGFDQFDNPIIISSEVKWSSSTSDVTVDQNGLAEAVSVGCSVITAISEEIQGSITITVWDSHAPRTEIYVSDVGTNRNGPHIIFKYDEDGQNGIAFISSNLSKPQDIVFLEDQKIVLVANLSSNNITKHDINSGEYKGEFATGINGPTRLEIGPDDLIYTIQWNGGPVKRYQKDGTFVDDFTSVSVNNAIGIAWDEEANLYVSSFNNGSNGYVKKFDTSGNDQGLFISSNLVGPTDIWFDNEGNILVNDWSGNKVVKFDSEGTYLEDFITGFIQPEGVDFLDGNILIGNSGNGSVKMYSVTGTFIKDIIAAGLKTTNAVTVRHVN